MSKKIKDICVFPLEETSEYGEFGMEVVFADGKAVRIHPLTAKECAQNLQKFCEQHLYGHVVTENKNGIARYKPNAAPQEESVLI